MTPFKVHASGSSQIMTNPKTISETLSQTCKTYVRQQWINDTFNRRKDFTSIAIQKGLMNEEKGITMLSMRLGEMLTKNDKIFHDDYKIGTPDLIMDDTVYDIKCSYDIFTYAASEITPAYEWQLQCYMSLLGIEKAVLVYVLTDTPASLIQAEVRSICWKLQDDSQAEQIEQELTRQKTYSDIPDQQRIKLFPIIFDPAKIELLHARVIECRDYYQSLTL